MNNPIKLTAEDIKVLEDNVYYYNEHGNHIDNKPRITIEGRPIEKAKQLKQQILDNQEKLEKVKKLEVEEGCTVFQLIDAFVIHLEHLTKENKLLKEDTALTKEKIEKIKIIFNDESVDDDTFFPKLEEILVKKS